jgi:hypothetical protein
VDFFHRPQVRREFFSEEKNQKTFAFDAIPDLSGLARNDVQAQGKKSFGSFLQKRTFFFRTAARTRD